MATNDEEMNVLDLENPGGEGEQEALKRAAQTDKVVRGVNGGVVPRARKLRPLAGLIVIAIVVLAALYMRHGMANRNKKTTKQAETAKVGVGPATNVEKGLLSDQARNGLDTGQMHVPDSLTPRSSIMNTDGGNKPGDPIPEYKREREAMEAATSVKGYLPTGANERSLQQPNDPFQAIQTALINARAAQSAGGGVQPASLQAGGLGSQEQRTEYERQNDQEQKEDFRQQHNKEESEYLGREREAARGRYEVKAGWLIPAVLEQQLNSDLPGLIRALVRENVYDTVTGKYVLIPAGSTLVGIYNSHVGYGQKALQAVWRRVIFPDGSSLSLGGFEGDDSEVAAGFRDQVDNHWGRIFSGALLTSLFAAGIQISQGQNSSVLTQPSYGQQIGQAVGQQIGQVGVEVTRRNLNIQPTIIVRPGYRFFVRVEKDLLFKGPYSAMPLRE
jgi:type IV secretory pathway VirB10-like protein